jgi:hypothetical protein
MPVKTIFFFAKQKSTLTEAIQMTIKEIYCINDYMSPFLNYTSITNIKIIVSFFKVFKNVAIIFLVISQLKKK